MPDTKNSLFLRLAVLSTWSMAALRLCYAFILLILIIRISPAMAESVYQIEIVKSAQELRLQRGDHTIRTFHIAYGKGDHNPKRLRGDNRTPVGNYHILDFRADSKFHFFMQLSYPNPVDAWHGYRDQIISPAEYKQIAMAFKKREMPPQDTGLGGYIGIHGIGETTSEMIKIHESVNWTEGCIALTNEEMNYLRQYITIGTPVVIKN